MYSGVSQVLSLRPALISITEDGDSLSVEYGNICVTVTQKL